ncbi:Cof-type HAD-IIB family hydrolase [Faecalibacterium prausnitzii]|uniref:Cof-type HAD-IIB family hydrolase n=1 Tax=Faecalibacterium prausnitzii TaxID=853 RepID=UPI0012DCF6CF|nr:Cof-type HAD-IIB family hydrolase [Faecalibacterium prausnitzii]
MSPSTPIRLVALDLDGTLLDSQSQISPRTRQAIADAVAHGVVVLPATGRPLSNLPPVVAQLTGIRYAITSNGAAVWDLGADPMGAVYSRYCNAAEHTTSEPTALIRCPMPVELAREVFALYMEYPGALSIFSDGRTYRDLVSMERFGKRFARRTGSTEARQPNDGRFTVVRDLTEWMSRHAHEVEKFCMFFDTPEQAQAALPRFRALPGTEVVQGAADNIEVTARGVDKGTALLALADMLGIPREATAAIGDSENDRAMLARAGVAAVMANALPEIRALGDIVSTCDNDHDGVAELFERLGL